MRSAALLLALCAGLLARTAEAHADVTLSAAVEPARLDYPKQRVLSYRLTMTTGEQQERLSVAPSPVPFSARQPVTLEGPGTLGFGIHGDPSPRPPECPRERTPITSFQHYTVTLPPRSTSVLVSPYTLVRAPWPAADMRVSYSFDSFPRIPTEPITFMGPSGLRSPQPALTGVSGVRITLATRPIARLGKPGTIRLGKAVSVRGHTTPRLPGQVVVLRAARQQAGARPFTIARVRAGREGDFRLRWRPPRRGTYGIYALYLSQRPALSDGSSPCNLTIRVR